MQADARLVEDVDDADQAHAKLRGEPDALRLAARQGGILALKRQVTKARLVQEVQALAHALDHFAHGVGRRQRGRQRQREAERLLDVALGEFNVTQPAEQHGGAARVQAHAVAERTLATRHERRQPRAIALAARFLARLVEQRDHARERLGLGLLRLPHPETEQPLARAVQQRMARCLRQVLPRRLRIERQLFGQLLEDRVVADDQVSPADAPGLDGAFAHGLLGLGHNQLVGERQLAAESAALGAGAGAVVEGKMPRRQRLEDIAADHAAQVLAERNFAPGRLGVFLDEHDRAVLALAKGEFQRVGEPAAVFRADDDAIHHEFHRDFLGAGRNEFRFVE